MSDPDTAYIEEARRDPAVRALNRKALDALGVHLWFLCREELTAVTVDSCRSRPGLLHGYVTNEEIQAEIDGARNRVFHALPDSSPFMGAASNWHGAHLQSSTLERAA